MMPDLGKGRFEPDDWRVRARPFLYVGTRCRSCKRPFCYKVGRKVYVNCSPECTRKNRKMKQGDSALVCAKRNVSQRKMFPIYDAILDVISRIEPCRIQEISKSIPEYKISSIRSGVSLLRSWGMVVSWYDDEIPRGSRLVHRLARLSDPGVLLI